MRLAALGLHHESNTFAPVPADLAAFEAFGITRRGEVAERFAGSHATLGGFLAAAGSGVEVVPLLFAYAEPMGAITTAAFEAIVGEMLALLDSEGPFDGVLLAQHGAAVADGHPDADAEIVRRVRAAVGPDVPIGMALDMHANLSPATVAPATVTVPYQTNPHVDARERALECAELVVRTVRGEITPVQALETPPLAVDILRQNTGEEPMAGLLAHAADLRERHGLLWAGVLEGFPYADVAEMGMSFLAIGDGDAAPARAAARALAEHAWRSREQLRGTAATPTEALEEAMRADRGPVVLMDVGDNIGGGAPGDSTVLLAEAQRLGVRSYLQTLHDPASVARAVAAGAGAEVTLDVGGKVAGTPGPPVRVSGRVRAITDGRFEEPTPVHGGHRLFDAGVSVVLETSDGHTLLLTTKKMPNKSLQQLHSAGIDPRAHRAVVAKGVNAPLAAYGSVAARVILVDTPGVTGADLTRFRYTHRRRPLFPLEREVTYSA